MSENKKLLSIIVPSYNMEAYLPKCLRSLIIDDKELLQRLDVIVVNDGSKDRTSAIAHEFEVKYPGVFRVIDKENGHYGSCVNVGLSSVQGLYVKVLDADDYVDTDVFCEFLVKLNLQINQGVLADVFITDYCSVNQEGKICSSSNYSFLPCNVFSMCDLNSLQSKSGVFIGLHAIFYRTEIFKLFRYKQTEGCCYTDTEWFSIPMAYAKNIQYFPMCVTQYLVGREGQSMDPKVYARDFYVLCQIAVNMIKSFDSLNQNSSIDGKEYLSSRIIDLLSTIYHGTLFGVYGYNVNLDLDKFDRTLKELNKTFYIQLNNLKAPSKRFNFYYVKDWRDYHYRFKFISSIYKFYVALIRFVKCFYNRDCR